MPPAASPCVLTINGGSSSIRFAVYSAGPRRPPVLKFTGKFDRIAEDPIGGGAVMGPPPALPA